MTATIMYGKLGANAFGGEVLADSFAIDWLSDTIKVALALSTYIPNPDTDETFADITNELGAGLGYTAGGATLGSKTVAYNATGNVTAFGAANTVWTAAGGVFGPFRYAIVYKSTGVAATSPLIEYVDFVTDQSVGDTLTFTIQWDPANGLYKATAV